MPPERSTRTLIRKNNIQHGTDLRRSDSRLRHRALLDTAAELFMEVGFEAASLNELVKRAGGSKSSIYSYFRDKDGLFAAVVDDMVDDLLVPLSRPVNLGKPLAETLRELGDHTLDVLTSKKGMGLSRIVVTESPRLPAIGRHFFEHGPGQAISQLAGHLGRLEREGQINCSDPDLAAEAFWGMLLHRPMLEGYCAVAKPMSRKKRQNYVDRIVRSFISGLCT